MTHESDAAGTFKKRSDPLGEEAEEEMGGKQ